MGRKILFVITKGNWGGAQRYVYDLATSLPRERFAVKVAVGLGQELPSRLREARIKTISLPALGRNLNLGQDLVSFFALLKIFWRERPDVIHLNSPKAAGLAALAGRLMRVPKIIYTVHGWSFHEDRWLVSRGLIWLASWFTVLLAHQTVVIAESEEISAKKMPWCQGKIRLIKNGLRAPHFYRLRVVMDEPLIGTVAELHRNKGLRYLLLALAELKDRSWKATIAGEGEERARLETLANELGLGERVSFPGFIESELIIPTFDIFVLPSLKEGLPYALLEAGLAERPVIATNVGGMPEVVENDYSGLLVPPKNPAALARALRTLLDSPGRRDQFGARLKQKVETEFSFERELAQWIELFEA